MSVLPLNSLAIVIWILASVAKSTEAVCTVREAASIATHSLVEQDDPRVADQCTSQRDQRPLADRH